MYRQRPLHFPALNRPFGTAKEGRDFLPGIEPSAISLSFVTIRRHFTKNPVIRGRP
jgi:hypothetical protein